MAKHLLSNKYEEGRGAKVWAMDLIRKYSKRDSPLKSHQLLGTPSTCLTDQIRAVR